MYTCPSSAGIASDDKIIIDSGYTVSVRAPLDVDTLVATLRERVQAGDHVVFMSNGGFDNAPRRFLATLRD